MPFSSGVFSRIYSWVTEQASPPIAVSKLDTQEQDFATAFNNCLLRDGTGVPTAATPWNGQNLTGAGTISATLFSGSGASLTSLPAGNLTGSVADARLSANVPLLNAANAFTAGQTATTGDNSVAVVAAATSGQIRLHGYHSSFGGAFIQIRNGDNSAAEDLTITAQTFSLAPPAGGLTLNAAGNLVVAAPGSGVALVVSAVGGNEAIRANAGPTNNIAIQAVDNAGVYSIYMRPGVGGVSLISSDYFSVGYIPLALSGRGDTADFNLGTSGGATIGAATGGDKGAGTLNTAGTIYVNNVAVALGNALNASALTSGTVPDARFPATLPTASGANLTALNATNVASGTLAAARLPASAMGTIYQASNKPYYYAETGGSSGGGKITVDTAGPSGTPADGEIWLQREA